MKACLKYIFLSVLLVISGQGFADPLQPVLNQIMYRTSAEQWVSTKTAKVVIDISATLNDQQLAEAHADILSKLNQLAKADWHLTQFNRMPNESGLEQLQALAQTRLPEEALADIRTQAKKISKPGETFKVDSIAFEPTLAESNLTRQQLRESIYQKIKLELAELNKIYPNQHYVVHLINFSENDEVSPVPGPRLMTMALASEGSGGTGRSLPAAVVNKMILTAQVVLVSVNQ